MEERLKLRFEPSQETIDSWKNIEGKYNVEELFSAPSARAKEIAKKYRKINPFTEGFNASLTTNNPIYFYVGIGRPDTKGVVHATPAGFNVSQGHCFGFARSLYAYDNVSTFITDAKIGDKFNGIKRDQESLNDWIEIVDEVFSVITEKFGVKEALPYIDLLEGDKQLGDVPYIDSFPSELLKDVGMSKITTNSRRAKDKNFYGDTINTHDFAVRMTFPSQKALDILPKYGKPGYIIKELPYMYMSLIRVFAYGKYSGAMESFMWMIRNTSMNYRDILIASLLVKEQNQDGYYYPATFGFKASDMLDTGAYPNQFLSGSKIVPSRSGSSYVEDKEVMPSDKIVAEICKTLPSNPYGTGVEEIGYMKSKTFNEKIRPYFLRILKKNKVKYPDSTLINILTRLTSDEITPRDHIRNFLKENCGGWSAATTTMNGEWWKDIYPESRILELVKLTNQKIEEANESRVKSLLEEATDI